MSNTAQKIEAAQHTPGRWIQKSARTMTHIHSVNGSMIGSLPIGFTPGKETYAKEGSEREANARLIAAAPELLTALETIVEYGACDENIEQARAAIAKATGKEAA